MQPEPNKETGDNHINAKIEHTAAFIFPAAKLIETSGPKAMIQNYVDFSTKYGIGYKLTNGVYGVLFNDSTKIVLDPNLFDFEYIARPASGQEEILEKHNFFNYPSSINKKVILLQHFKSFLDGNQKFKPISFSFGPTDILPKREHAQPLPYLKKWRKTPESILFRLTNKLIQVVFSPSSGGAASCLEEMIINSSTGAVTYVNSERCKPITYVNMQGNTKQDDPRVEERLKMAKEVIMMSTNQQRPKTAIKTM